MTDDFVSFDSVSQRVEAILESMDLVALQGIDVYLVRNLHGKVRIIADEPANKSIRAALADLATRLSHELGAHGHPPNASLLTLDISASDLLGSSSRTISEGVFWVDRMVTSNEWATIHTPASQNNRYTLFSVKGGVGRSTTAIVLAWHLARKGERVLVVDLDMESPGLGSAVLDHGTHPAFGVVDWFIEDLVDQADHVVEGMTGAPTWARDLEGAVTVVPAHGRAPGEYLAKLGRVYLDTDICWTERINRMITQLEAAWRPTIVLIESRSGLHDIAASTVTDLGADILLFTTDSESSWTGYEILFAHWGTHQLAEDMRKRLFIVSALTPEIDTEQYLARFSERSWDLFRDHLYDDVPPMHADGGFSFDLHDVSAPHSPFPIYWNRGMAAGTSLHSINAPSVKLAYSDFLSSFDSQLRPAKTQ